jgi:hypothetical protein
MARITYTGANGEQPPLSELEKEKLKGQRLANDIARTKLRRLHEEILERREVKFVFDTTLIVLRQELMRWPSLVVREPELRSLSHEQIFAIRMSADKFIRAELDKATDSLEKALRSPREAIAELVGEEEQPSQKEIDAAARKRARTNAKRRERRKAKAKP